MDPEVLKKAPLFARLDDEASAISDHADRCSGEQTERGGSTGHPREVTDQRALGSRAALAVRIVDPG